jgi:hypothetical protein
MAEAGGRGIRIWACALVAACSAAVAATALAAAPTRGATYRGALVGARSAIRVSFRVSASGGQVDSITVSALPLYCSGQAPPGARLHFGSAKLGADGRFTATGMDKITVGPLKGSVIARLKLSGAFGAHGTETGVLTSTFLGGLGAKCSGHSSYRTKA